MTAVLLVASAGAIGSAMAGSGGYGSGWSDPSDLATPLSGTVKPSSSAADLVVVDIQLDPEEPIHGDHIEFTALVHNQGNATAGPTETYFQIDQPDGPDTSVDTPSIDPNETVSVTTSPSPSVSEGNHTITAVADNLDDEPELNETNNDRTETFHVSSIPIPGPGSPGEVLNGGFETGTHEGWGVINEGSGDWYVYSGTTSPQSGHEIAPPPEGEFAATTDQGGPGSHILAQDIAVPETGEQRLSFLLYYENHNGEFHTPNTLAHDGDPNQQYRVDLIDPNASVDSVASEDVVENLFITEEGDPLSSEPTLMAFNLSEHAGETLRLRFAEVDNQNFFLASVDLVQFGVPEFSDPAVGDVEVQKTRLRTDFTDPVVNPAASIDVTIDVENTASVPMKAEASVEAFACPEEGDVFRLPSLGCEFIGDGAFQLDANGSSSVELTWDHQGSVGDFEVCAFVDYSLPQNVTDNDQACTETFVVVGGTGLGGARIYP